MIDYYLLDEDLPDDTRTVRDRVLAFVDAEVLPVINDYWDRAEFPHPLVPRLAELGIVGGTISGYGCPGFSPLTAGIVTRAISRGDGSGNTFLGVQTGLAMGSIALLGSEEQKQRWLPAMAALEKVGAFALTLRGVRVPAENELAGGESFRDASRVLTATRGGAAWESLGHAMAAYEIALAYAKERVQFGRPVASFQLVQHALAGMLAEITAMQLYCVRMAELQARGRWTGPMASLAKMHHARKARQVCLDARDVLGGNGLLLEHHVARHLTDMEVVHTYEGTDNIQSLIVGRDVTGISAFT